MVTGDLHAAAGQFEIALAAYSEAIVIAEQGGEKVSQAMSMHKRGDTLAKLGRYQEARSDLTKAAEIFADEHYLEDEAAALRSFAEAVTKADDPK